MTMIRRQRLSQQSARGEPIKQASVMSITIESAQRVCTRVYIQTHARTDALTYMPSRVLYIIGSTAIWSIASSTIPSRYTHAPFNKRFTSVVDSALVRSLLSPSDAWMYTYYYNVCIVVLHIRRVVTMPSERDTYTRLQYCRINEKETFWQKSCVLRINWFVRDKCISIFAPIWIQVCIDFS